MPFFLGFCDFAQNVGNKTNCGVERKRAARMMA
jgi:hypothetical protein